VALLLRGEPRRDLEPVSILISQGLLRIAWRGILSFWYWGGGGIIVLVGGVEDEVGEFGVLVRVCLNVLFREDGGYGWV